MASLTVTPGSITLDESFSAGGWIYEYALSNPDNGRVENGVFATVDGAGSSDAGISPVNARNFDLSSLPANATITGYKVRIKDKVVGTGFEYGTSASHSSSNKVSLIVASNEYGVGYTSGHVGTAEELTTTPTSTLAWREVGADGQTFGRSLTAAQIKDNVHFGIKFMFVWEYAGGSATTYSLDSVELTIYYTVPAPDAPTNVAATDGSHTDKVVVTWTGSSGATGYKVYRHTSDSSGASTLIATLGDVVTYDDTTATAGITYYYWVKASNGTGDSSFSTSNSGYRIVSAPGSVSATDSVYTDKVVITWASATGATGYKVYRHTSDSSGSATLLATLGDVQTYDDTTAVAGTTYYFWLKTVSSSGDSAFSTSDAGTRAVASSGSSSSGSNQIGRKVIGGGGIF